MVVKQASFLSLPGEKLRDEMGEVMAAEAGDDVALLVGLVEEEQAALVGLVGGGGGHIDGLHGRGVDAGVVHLGRERHGRGGEVLNLLQPVAHLLHVDSQLRHVLQAATGVAADKVRDELVAQARLFAYLGKPTLGLAKELEARLAHQRQHMVGGMLRRHLETAGGVVQNHLFKILPAGVGLCTLLPHRCAVVPLP